MLVNEHGQTQRDAGVKGERAQHTAVPDEQQLDEQVVLAALYHFCGSGGKTARCGAVLALSRVWLFLPWCVCARAGFLPLRFSQG